MENSLTKPLLIGAAALGAAFIVFGSLALLDNGYRFSGLRVVAPGIIDLKQFPEGGRLYVDGQEFQREPQGGQVHLSLSGGHHDLIISREGFWPWEKEILVPNGQTFEFDVFLMPTSPVGVPILKNPERRALDVAFSQATVPTRSAPALSDNGSVAIFAEDGKVVALWRGEEAPPQYYCANDPACEEHVALSFDAELRDLAFYPGRNDIALLAIQNGIFALELDNRGTQNFQPVYRGTRPRLLIKDGAAYLHEGLAVLRLSL